MRNCSSETVVSLGGPSYALANLRLLFSMDNQRIGFTLTMRLIASIGRIRCIVAPDKE